MSTDSVGVAVSESTSNSVPEPHSQHPQQNDGGSGKSSVAALSVESKPGEMSKSKWKDMLSRRQRVIVAATIAVLSVVIVAGLLYYFLGYRPAHAGSTGKSSNAITVDPNSPAVKAEFSAWMTKFDKKYLDADSLQNAYNNWLVNYAIVLNHDPTTAPGNLVLGLGPYADLTQQQFEKQMLTANAGMANTSTGGAAPDPQGDDLFSYYFNTNNVPTSLNWGTNPAMISPVKNQYSCGNCWAMAATEGVEVAYNVAYQPSSSIVLSVEQITSCDPYNGGCNGGWPHVVWEHYLAPGSGNYLTTEAIYPFNSANGITTPCNATAAATGIVELGGNPGWRWVTPPVSAWSLEAELLMIEALQTSPITVCVDARIWGGYYGGIMTNEAGCTGTGYVDHCVQLVGYTETYWIAKNQWGTGWGMNGFMYLARGENTCCILCYPTQVTLQLKAPYSSLGCFNDAATHALNIYIGTGFNVATCYAWAKAIGSAYFGLVGGTACYVGNTNYATYGNYGSPSFPGYPAGACAATCSDGSSGPCGGSWSVSVYQVNGVTPSCSTSQYWTETATGTSGNPVCMPCGGTATSAGGTATSCSRYELLGCFNDENPRALTLSISSATTIDSCYAYASANGYAYFGMEVGNECWVGNGNFAVYGSFGEPGTPAPAFVSGPCANVGTDGVGPAGGPWALSVYKVNAVTISCPANYYYSVSQPSTMGNGVCLPCGASGLSAGGQPSSCYCPNSMTWAAGFGCQALEAAGCAAPASVATSTYCALGGSGVLVGLIPSDSYCAESNGVNAAFPAAGTITSISIQFAGTPTASGVYKLKILTEQTPGSANFALVSESLFHPALTTAVQTVQLVTPLQVQAGQFFGFYSSNVGIASIPGTSVSYYQCGADFVSTSYTALTQWTSYLPNIQVFYQQGVGCSAPASVAVNTYCVSGGTGVIVSLPTSSAYCTEASGLSAAFSQEGIVNAVSVQFASAPSSSGVYTIKILEQQVVGSANFKVVAESNFYPAATTAVQTVFLANSLSVSAGQFFGFYSSNAGIASIPGSSVTYFECSANFEATTFTALSQWTSYHPNIEVFYTPVTPAWLGLGCLAPASAASSSYCSGGGSGVIVGFISGSEYCSGSTSSVGAFPSAGTVSAISIQFATAPTSTGVYKLKIVSQQSPGSANFLLVSESPFYPALTTAVQTVNLVTPLQVQAGQFYGFYSSNAGIASIPGTSQSYFECGLDFEATSYTALASWTGYLPNIEVFYQQGVGCSAPATVAVDSYCSAGGSGVIVSLPTGSGIYCTESSGLNAAFSQAGIVTAVSVQFASAPSSSGIYKVKILEQQSAASPANFILVSESVFYPAPTTALQTVLLQTPLAVSAGQFFGYYSSNVGIAAIPGSSTTYFQCSADFEATSFTALNLWNSYHPNIEVFLQ